jgi:hypothetical protein
MIRPGMRAETLQQSDTTHYNIMRDWEPDWITFALDPSIVVR